MDSEVVHDSVKVFSHALLPYRRRRRSRDAVGGVLDNVRLINFLVLRVNLPRTLAVCISYHLLTNVDCIHSSKKSRVQLCRVIMFTDISVVTLLI